MHRYNKDFQFSSCIRRTETHSMHGDECCLLVKWWMHKPNVPERYIFIFTLIKLRKIFKKTFNLSALTIHLQHSLLIIVVYLPFSHTYHCRYNTFLWIESLLMQSEVLAHWLHFSPALVSPDHVNRICLHNADDCWSGYQSSPRGGESRDWVGEAEWCEQDVASCIALHYSIWTLSYQLNYRKVVHNAHQEISNRNW